MPRWLKELIWVFNAWFATMLPVIGGLVLYRGQGVGTGLECIAMGLLNLLFAGLSWSNRPRYR